MTAITVDHLLNQVRAFVNEQVAPAAADWSMGAEPDPALFSRAGALNLMGIEVPADLGGLGLGFAVKTHVCEIIAAAELGDAEAMEELSATARRMIGSASTNDAGAPPAGRDRRTDKSPR